MLVRGRVVRLCITAVLAFSSAAAFALVTPAPSRPATAPATTFPSAGLLEVDAVRVRTQPDRSAPVIRIMHYFRSDYRRQEIFAVASTVGSDGQQWYRISVPGRPNGQLGWIPVWAASLTPTVAKVIVHRASFRIDLYWHGQHVWRAKVAVGAPGMETPLGLFYATARFVPHNDPYLVTYAVETSGYSKLTEWPGGGVFGIHGTPDASSLGHAASHGCVRVSSQTALKLKSYVPLGTPIYITNT